MAYADPATIVATGAHQEYGECHVKELDLMGYEREAFLCKDSFNEDFTFDCAAATSQTLPPTVPTWFTICGRAHVNYALYVGVSAAIGLCGVISYTAMLLPGTRDSRLLRFAAPLMAVGMVAAAVQLVYANRAWVEPVRVALAPAFADFLGLDGQLPW
jgi:hypothetical protein